MPSHVDHKSMTMPSMGGGPPSPTGARPGQATAPVEASAPVPPGAQVIGTSVTVQGQAWEAQRARAGSTGSTTSPGESSEIQNENKENPSASPTQSKGAYTP